MLVNFDYECLQCGVVFEGQLNSVDYPNREWPKLLLHCDFKDTICEGKLETLLTTKGMQPDNYWAGKYIPSLGINVNSKSYLKRYCKTEGISQLTNEETKTTKSKNKKQLIIDHMNRPEVARERQRIISESLDGYGVIDSVNMEK